MKAALCYARLLLLILPTLATLSCSQKTSDPAPPVTLLAKWEGLNQRLVETNASGQVIHESTITYIAKKVFKEFKATEVTSYAAGQRYLTWEYIRTGNEIHLTNEVNSPLYIQELTPTRLVLMSKYNGSNYSGTSSITYKR